MTKLTRRNFMAATAAAPLTLKGAVESAMGEARGIVDGLDLTSIDHPDAPFNMWLRFAKHGVPEWKRRELLAQEMEEQPTNAKGLRSVSDVHKGRMVAREVVERRITMNIMDEVSDRAWSEMYTKFMGGAD